MSIADRKQEILEELELFPEWTERYEYLVNIGRRLPPMPEGSRTNENVIEGCQARVWLDASFENGKVHYVADSNSQITKGMIALFIRLLNDESPDEIVTADLSFLAETGLKEHLVSMRANALNLMVKNMKQRAFHFASQA